MESSECAKVGLDKDEGVCTGVSNFRFNIIDTLRNANAVQTVITFKVPLILDFPNNSLLVAFPNHVGTFEIVCAKQ